MAGPFAIAHVTPYPWEARDNEVNAAIADLSRDLCRRGHRVLILAPSRSPETVRASRRELREARATPAGGRSLLAAGAAEPKLVAIGEVLDVGLVGLGSELRTESEADRVAERGAEMGIERGAEAGTRGRRSRSRARARMAPLPVDVARTLEELLTHVPLDFVHVHEPLAPSASSTALRYSRALNVGTFYRHALPSASTGLARRFSENFLSRLDARLAAREQTVDSVQAAYERLAARRHDSKADDDVRRRVVRRRMVDVDLHMHTDHSHDCETPVEVLLAAAKEAGLGAIAVTDHNEISGALEAREKSKGTGVKVIVGEEIKTASQGEVIGLFIEEKIPRGLTLAETVAEIKRQGGLVYVPHPFDRMHSVPDYEHLLPIIDDVDAIEVFNARVAIGSFNDEAVRFAAKYRIVAGAGSDAHVAQGLGSVRIRMHDFDGPAEFLESLRAAEITTKPRSLVYVQALKFLQTKATPAGARRAARERRVRKATRDGGAL